MMVVVVVVVLHSFTKSFSWGESSIILSFRSSSSSSSSLARCGRQIVAFSFTSSL